MSLFSSLPWVGIIVGTLLCFFFGALWYGPINGKKWMKAVGITQADIDREEKERPKLMLGEFIMTLVSVFMLSIVLGWANPQNLVQAIHVGFILFLGFFLPMVVSQKLWQNTSNDLFFIQFGYGIIAFTIMSASLYLLG